jgi:hypothetical protein
VDNRGKVSRVCHGVRMSDAILNPAARVLWRGRDVVQLELGQRAVVLDGVDRATVARLTGRADADGGGRGASLLRSALPALSAAGFLVRGAPRSATHRPAAPRLATQLTALRARFGDEADRVLARRRRASVTVRGTNRLAAPIGAALAAGGVGRIAFTGQGDVRLDHCAPGGLGPAEEGQRFAAAAVDAVHRAAPDCDTGRLPVGMRPTLVVLATDGPVDSEVREMLQASGCPHLVAQASCESGQVGPLVLPGRSSCLHCADLHRVDRDPAWPVLAVQLGIPDRHGAGADVALSMFIASVTALQALSYLDGIAPTTVDGTVELHLPDWRLRRRSWPAHPDCDCGAYADSGDAAPPRGRTQAEWTS